MDKPENVVKVNDRVFWIIEAKSKPAEIGKAVKEAKAYAAKVNRGSRTVQALFISGVAGNDTDSYVVETYFRANNGFRPISFNGKQIASLISPDIARMVMDVGPTIEDVPIPESLYLAKAERINQILHLGAINKNSRARVMAALLLSLAEDSRPDVGAQPQVLIRDINTRAEHVLRSQGKPDFIDFIKIALPPTTDNHLKFKAAIVQTLQELDSLNIRAAMKSGTDVLGKFYEVFLKYGNGAKEIGIVLTPRHITKFAVDVIGISDRDLVYDPTCGTGGFLVAAFDAVSRAYSDAQVNRFKQNCLFGAEQEPEVVALAIVNMIFRGDGKMHIVEGNCFRRNLIAATNGRTATAEFTEDALAEGDEAVTRVLMNPPFALKASDEKEFKFVDHALQQMQDGGILFSVLPYPAMVKQGVYRAWRSTLLEQHSLLCVMTFPDDLFYPIGVHTIGVFIRKGTPQNTDQNVLWVRALRDGRLKSKGKRLPVEHVPNDLITVQNTVQAFLGNPGRETASIAQFQRACPIDLSDPLLELIPENYLDQAPPTEQEIRQGVERMMRESAAYLIQSGRNHVYQPN